MRRKIYALIVSALAVALTAPVFALTAFAAPEDNADETDAADAAEDAQETEPPQPADTKPFDAEAFLESYTTATTYDYYGDPYYDTDGNASLISDKHVIYSSDQIQFISVATKDGHVFYIVIDYTDTDGDNVYFLNKVDDFDMFRLLYSGKQDENTNLVEEYQAQQGNTAVVAPVDQQKQGTRKTEPTTPTEPADNPSGGLSTELLMYLIGGVVFVLALVIFLILRVRSIRKNRIPTDDFDDDDDDEDITGSSGEYEIK
ncbi:MAG: DUF4366 domain-containing protein [Acutalibacteraceae bacterium]|nr:DUF4366 domain-containing protein [Acutalibacteraceae bacterium]